MNVLELSEQEICRRNSLEELRKMGINPYPAAAYPVNAYSTEIKEAFDDQAEPREVCVAGRMMSRRVMGKASFAEWEFRLRYSLPRPALGAWFSPRASVSRRFP